MMSVENEGDHDKVGENSAGMIDHTVTLYLAAAVVVEDDRVLVVRRSKLERFHPSVWGVPCGKVDKGESVREAVVRELWEETGLAGRVVRYLGSSTFSSIWHGQLAENIQSNFLVHPLGTKREIRLSKEDQAATWLSRHEINDFDGLDAHNREVIEQWLRSDDRVKQNLITHSGYGWQIDSRCA
jgi:8-oxo-dGTP diphosphatase